MIILSGRVLFLFAIILPLNADNVETPLADLLLRADPIVLGRIGVGLPVRDESLLQSLKPVAQGEWRRTELCQFVLTSEQIIRSSVPLDSIGLDVYMFGEKGSCDLSYARVTPGERYLWLLRRERGILRAVVDTHQARVLVRSLPHAWQTVTIDREWQWKVTYLLTAPETPDTIVSNRFTGDLVDAVGWHVWFDVLAELDTHYPDSYGAGICGLLVDLGACCRCGPSGQTEASVRPRPTPALERRLSRLVAAKSLDELESVLKTTSHRSIRLELEAAACNVSAPVASSARATLKSLFGIQAGRCPSCGGVRR